MPKFLSVPQSPGRLPVKSFLSNLNLCFCCILSAAFMLLKTSLVQAQSETVPAKQWDKTLGGSTTESLSISITTADGGYLLAGTSYSGIGGDRTEASRGGNDYWVVKTNSSGVKQWDKRFGTTADDYLTSVIQTTDGGYLLGGYTTAGVNGDKSQAGRGENDYWIVKINSAGVKQWDKRFGGTENDRLFYLIQTTDGGYLLGGLSNSEANGDKTDNSLVGEADEPFRNWNDFWVIKISSIGTKQWDNTVGGYYGDDYFGSLITTADGGYVVSGSRFWLACSDCEMDLTSYTIVKLSSDGAQEWVGYFGGAGDDVLSDVVQTIDGGYLLAGSSGSGLSPTKTEASIGGQGNYNPADYWIIKLNSAGIRQWDYVFGTTGSDILSAILKTADGGYLLAGYTDGGAEYDKTEASRGSNDYWFVKINNSGIKQWDKRFGGSSDDKLSVVLSTADNGYVLAGTSTSGNSGDKSEASKGSSDFWLLKTVGAPPITCKATGTVLREVWKNVPGIAVSTIPANTAPTSSNQLTSFEAPSNVDNSYGQRLSGYLCVPTTGTYTFYIAGDNNCELWLSTDENAAKKVKIAHISGELAWTPVRNWTKYASQKSVAIALVAGKNYYIEALHKENANGDNLAVGWIPPGQTSIAVIPGERLSPAIAPLVQITSPANYTPFLPGMQITIAANAAAPKGSIQEVEFFNGAIKIGEDLIPPYSVSFPAMAAGTYKLTARATSNAGITATSLPVTIYVSETSAARKQWDKTLGGTGYDGLITTIPTADGGYLLGGISYSGMGGDKTQASRGGADYWIVKISSSGVKQWDKRFGGPNNDRLSALIQTNEGGYLLGGTSYSGMGGDKTEELLGYYDDNWIIKVDANGNKQWDKTYGSALDDDLTSILQTSDGGYLLGANMLIPESDPNFPATDFSVTRLNVNGIKQWDKTFGGSGHDKLYDMIQTADGGYLLGGNSNSPISRDKSEASRGQEDYWVVKITNTGAKQWDKTLGGSITDQLNAIIQTTNGDYIVGGTSYSGISGDKSEPVYQDTPDYAGDYWVVKLNSSGSKQWDKTLGGGLSEYLGSMIETTDGNYILGGGSDSGISGNRTESSRGDQDFWLVKLDKTGAKLWDRAYGSTYTDYLSSVIQAADGGYLLAGFSNSGIGGEKSEASKGENDFWIVKTFPDSAPACAYNGTILHEIWTNITGPSVSSIPVNTIPTSSSQLPVFETPSNVDDSYGQRLRGYLCVPVSSNYTFYIAGDNNCELWLSTDETAAKKVKIAHISGDLAWTPARVWNKYSTQKSVPIALVAGKKYYIEALHKDNANGDNLAVAWTLPGTSAITVIAGSYLSPFMVANPLARMGQEQEWQTTQISVHPNPFDDKLTIRTSLKGKLHISLTNALGSLVYQTTKQAKTNELELDLLMKGLKAGVYMLILQAEDATTQVVRVIKK